MDPADMTINDQIRASQFLSAKRLLGQQRPLDARLLHKNTFHLPQQLPGERQLPQDLRRRLLVVQQPQHEG